MHRPIEAQPGTTKAERGGVVLVRHVIRGLDAVIFGGRAPPQPSPAPPAGRVAFFFFFFLGLCIRRPDIAW